MRMKLLVLFSVASCAAPQPQTQNTTVVQTMNVTTMPGSVSEVRGTATLYSNGRLEALVTVPQSSVGAVCMFRVDYKGKGGFTDSIGPMIATPNFSVAEGAVQILAFPAKCEDKPFVFQR